jgi:hypothetical protein
VREREREREREKRQKREQGSNRGIEPVHMSELALFNKEIH